MKRIKKLFSKFTNYVKQKVNKVKTVFTVVYAVLTSKVKTALAGTAGEAYVDTGVKILIAVVVGAALLAALYALFGDTIMPTVTEKVEGLFEYAG